MSDDRLPPEMRFKHPIGMGVWGILWRDWDPIGMKEMDGPDDEYDAYVWPLIGKIMQGADREDVADYLDWATNVHMELGGDPARVRAQHLILADRLVSLKTTES